VKRNIYLFCLGLIALASSTCATDEGERVIVLPPEADRYERFINRVTRIVADRIEVRAINAYGRDVVPAVDPDTHTRKIESGHITVVNNDPGATRNPVRLSFRNLHLAGRQRIDVYFSDAPLERDDVAPVLVKVVATGVAQLVGDGVELVGDRVVVTNDDAKAFAEDGREIPPLKDESRRSAPADR